MKLETTKEKVLEAAAASPEAKKALQNIFPQVFEQDHDTNIKQLADLINTNTAIPRWFYDWLPGLYSDEKAKLLYNKYIKPYLK